MVSGVDAFLLHVTTTPSVAYVVRDFPVYRSYDGMRVGWIIPTEVCLILQRTYFDALSAKTYVVGNEPDGININMGCGPVYCRG